MHSVELAERKGVSSDGHGFVGPHAGYADADALLNVIINVGLCSVNFDAFNLATGKFGECFGIIKVIYPHLKAGDGFALERSERLMK